MYFSWKKELSLSRCGSAQEEMETGISSGSLATRNPRWLKLVPLCKTMMVPLSKIKLVPLCKIKMLVARMEMVLVHLGEKK